MPLTDDQYTCLLIMKDGENLIRMRDTRWYAPLGELHALDYAKPIGNENFVITQKGQHALVEHESGESALLRQMITKQGEVNAVRQAVHAKMIEAKLALVAAARIGSDCTGEPVVAELEKVSREVVARALEMVR